MLLRNPITGNSISENELEYFIRLKLERPHINDLWISENLNTDEIEDFVMLSLNNKQKSIIYFENPKSRVKLSRHAVEEFRILQRSEENTIQLLPNGDVTLDMYFTTYLKIRRINRKKHKIYKRKDLYPVFNIKLVICSFKIIDQIMKITLVSEV
jgi:hypothetical protein